MTEPNKKMCGNMLGVANAYKTSSELLNVFNDLIKDIAAKRNITFPDGRAIKFDDVILSRIILYSINIEILLKSIYLAENDKPIKGHDWVKLFNSLSNDCQSEIIDKMQEQFKADFHSLLEKNKDTFVKWRYSYESQRLECNIDFIHNFANVLAGIAMKLAN